MKTKIRTLVIVFALGLIGLNSTASINRIVISDNSGSAFTFENEEDESAFDYRKEAQQISKWVADQEEAKAMQKLSVEGLSVTSESNLRLNDEAGVDYRAEAQLITKLIVDQAEAKAILKIQE